MGGEERIEQGRVWETLKVTAIDGGKLWPLMEEHSVVGLEGAGKNLAPTLQSPAKASHWLNLGVRPSLRVWGDRQGTGIQVSFPGSEPEPGRHMRCWV